MFIKAINQKRNTPNCTKRERRDRYDQFNLNRAIKEAIATYMIGDGEGQLALELVCPWLLAVAGP